MHLWQIILFIAGIIFLSLGLVVQHTSPLWGAIGITAGLLSLMVVGYTLKPAKR